MSETVLSETRGSVAILTLNRPVTQGGPRQWAGRDPSEQGGDHRWPRRQSSRRA